MKIRVQLVVCDDDGHEATFTDVAVFEKACQCIEHLGLTLAEAKQILAALQQRLVEQQTAAFVAAQAQCDRCGKALGIKKYYTRTFPQRSHWAWAATKAAVCIIVAASGARPPPSGR